MAGPLPHPYVPHFSSFLSGLKIQDGTLEWSISAFMGAGVEHFRKQLILNCGKRQSTGHPGFSSCPCPPWHATKTQLFTQSLLSLLLSHSPHSSFSATGPLQIITLYHPDDFNSSIVSLSPFLPFPTPFFPNSWRDPLKMQIWEFLGGPVVSAFTAEGAGSITGQGTQISSNKMQICQCLFLTQNLWIASQCQLCFHCLCLPPCTPPLFPLL